MKFELIAPDDHRLEESYSSAFSFADLGSEHDFKSRHVQYTARPSSVILGWRRTLTSDWRRGDNSRIIGRRVLKSGAIGEQQTTAAVFNYCGDLTPLATSIPELVELIAEIEARLPAPRRPLSPQIRNDAQWVLKSLFGSQNFTDAALRLANAINDLTAKD